MAKKTKASRIGFDPLAWMKDGAAEQPSAKTDAAPKKAAAEQAAGQHRHREPSRDVRENDSATKAAKVSPDGDKPATPSSDGGPATVVLGESLTIKDVGRLQDELKQALASSKGIALQAASVESVDAAGLQLLDALMQEARTRRVDVQWRDPSGVLVRGARTLGLADKLQLPS